MAGTFTESLSPIPTTPSPAAAQFDVAYNAAKVSLAEVVPEAVFSNHVVRSREVSPGVRRVLVYSRENATVIVTNSRAAVTLPFTVSPTEYVGSGPISPLDAVLARADATAITPVTLNAGSIFVRPVNVQPDGAQFFLPSEPGTNYVIQATTNLVNRTDISTNTAFGTFLDLFDPDATNFPYRFYRSAR